MLLSDRIMINPYQRKLRIIQDRLTPDMYKQATVMEIGTDISDVKVGDKILFGNQAGASMNGSIIIRESDIIATIDEWI